MQNRLPPHWHSTSPGRQIDAVLTLMHRVAHDSLIAAYLYGSSLSGGLQRYSDLDVLVVVGQRLCTAARHALAAELLKVSAPPDGPENRPLEVTIVTLPDVVPWRYPPRCEFQFGEWLRPQLECGEVPAARADADLAILLATLLRNNAPLYGPEAAVLLRPVPERDVLRAVRDTHADVLAGWADDARNAVLTLARMWATCVTGQIMPKHDAADWASRRLSAAHRAVVLHARSEYLGREFFDWDAEALAVHGAVQELGCAVRKSLASAAERQRLD